MDTFHNTINQYLYFRKPDYVCFCDKKPKIVIDAKSPDENIDDYTYQVSGYALSLNKQFKGENPVRFTVLTNGDYLKVYNWDEEEAILVLTFEDFMETEENEGRSDDYKEKNTVDNVRRLRGSLIQKLSVIQDSKSKNTFGINSYVNAEAVFHTLQTVFGDMVADGSLSL